MSNVPTELKYSKEHEWVKREGDLAVIGITDYAQSELGDIVYVELPEVGQEFSADDEFGSLESVKAVSEIYTPLSGQIVEVNEALEEFPELVNDDPYGEGWLSKIRLSDESQWDGLMDAAAYSEFLAQG